MTTYEVQLHEAIEADSPREAAAKLFRMLRDNDGPSRELTFVVSDLEGNVSVETGTGHGDNRAPLDPLRTVYVCGTCGRPDVTSDANARWNADANQWEVSSVMDDSFCEHCDGETSIAEVQMPSGTDSLDGLAWDFQNKCWTTCTRLPDPASDSWSNVFCFWADMRDRGFVFDLSKDPADATVPGSTAAMFTLREACDLRTEIERDVRHFGKQPLQEVVNPPTTKPLRGCSRGICSPWC
ncbi:MAG TPA: hypothetical protein VFQ88_15200 [Nevskiaceae bacterium]|nr:hypothetical protein [Nevskiaceae bacterium]